MKVLDIETLIARVNGRLTYKDWTFELKRADNPFPYMGGPQVELAWSHPGADRHTGDQITVYGRTFVNLPMPFDADDLTQKVLLAEIWTVVIRAETHEAMEQFQVGGVCVYDPHPAGGSATSPNTCEPDLSGLYAKEPTA